MNRRAHSQNWFNVSIVVILSTKRRILEFCLTHFKQEYPSSALKLLLSTVK